VTAPPVRHFKRETKGPDYYGVQVNTVELCISEPNTVEETMSCSERKKWRYTMKAKF